MNTKNTNKFFTLIELLITVGIIIILAAILMPTLYQAKYFARLYTCKSNIRQISTGLFAYSADFSNWFPDGPQSKGGQGSWGEGRTRSYDIDSTGSYTDVWSSYYQTGELEGYENMSPVNEFFRCPEGYRNTVKIVGVPSYNSLKNTIKFYSIFCNTFHGMSSRKAKPYFPTYVNQHGKTCHLYGYANPERVMRKLGDVNVWANTNDSNFHQGHKNWHSSILVSDITMKNAGGGKVKIFTNHYWEGKPQYNSGGYTSVIRWYSADGRPAINYGMSDGSVRQFSGRKGKDIRQTMEVAGNFGFSTQDGYVLPCDYLEDPNP